MTTPTVLIAASNLTANIGLAPNTAMTTLLSSLSSNALITAIGNITPGVTATGNTLSTTYGFNIANIGLPAWVGNANVVLSNVATQASRILPSNGDGTYNISRFAGMLGTASSFVQTSAKMYLNLGTFETKTFDDIGLHTSDYLSSITNGISSQFGGSTDSQTISNNLKILARALANLGELYSITDLSRVGTPYSIIDQLIKRGFADETTKDTGYITVAGFLLPVNWRTDMDQDELQQFLNLITGPGLERIIEQSGASLPYLDAISSAGQLTDLSMVFEQQALDLVPDKNFAGLANELVNIGGSFDSLQEFAGLIESIEVPNLTYLNALDNPVPPAVASQLQSVLGSGDGPDGNPLITDLLGSASGIPHVGNLTVLSDCITQNQSNTAIQNLQTQSQALYSAVATGNASFINANIALTWTAANAVVSQFSNNALSVGASTAVTNMDNHVRKELTNLSLAGIDIVTYPTNPGTRDALALADRLYDYGVDRDNQNFEELLSGLAQANAGGDSVRACMVEGRNIDRQLQRSVLINSKSYVDSTIEARRKSG